MIGIIITALLAIGAGLGAGWFVFGNQAKQKAEQLLKEAEAQAEILKKDKLLEAKENICSSSLSLT